MSDWIYCATDAQVNAQNTAALLYPHGAIWCCPPGLRQWNGNPAAGEKLQWSDKRLESRRFRGLPQVVDSPLVMATQTS